MIGIGRALTLYQTIKRLVILISATTALAVSCADSVTESHQCRLNEQVRIEPAPANGLLIPRFSIIAETQHDKSTELAQFPAESDATYVEQSLFGSYLRAVISRTDPPLAVSWEDQTGVVDPVVCTLGEFLIVGLVDDGTARMRLDGAESTRPVPSGNGVLVGPAEVFVSDP